MTEPEVSVPAVMRNYHEVLRNDLARVLAPLAAAGDLTGFAAAWDGYCAAIAVHAAMEDGVEGSGGGSAAMLDHYFDGAAGASVFKEEHVHEHANQRAVTAAMAEGPVALHAAFEAYRVAAEAHLKHEEEVMMPLVVRLPTPKAPKFAQWCVSAGIAHGGFEHFVAHGVRVPRHLWQRQEFAGGGHASMGTFAQGGLFTRTVGSLLTHRSRCGARVHLGDHRRRGT